MILTGKAKEDFIKWYYSKCDKQPYFQDYSLDLSHVILNALIIEWFDSIGININIIVEHDRKAGYVRGFESEVCFIMNSEFMIVNSDCLKSDIYETRQQATEEAIKKACDIYNKN